MIIRIVVYFKNCCPLFVPTFKAQIGGVFFVSDASNDGLIFFHHLCKFCNQCSTIFVRLRFCPFLIAILE